MNFAVLRYGYYFGSFSPDPVLVIILTLPVIKENIIFLLFNTDFFFYSNFVTVQPLHLLVFIFMKTRSLVVPPYADLDEKVLMQASLQHTFSFKPAHG
ncbi:hypothetical protein DWZ86_02850 [Clostridiales bacterium AF36-10]|jgi:hypothetical protein|nr:hypothetical protein DW677_01995 [Clostridium sp. AM25-23AC]RGE13524.1 hypothetical protein DXC33_00930 [Clostridiaceae bacterium TF01-6]RJW89872.1 hypothetical protein DWZ86_02850 [Clostridiales bacterium AF36-10]